VAGPTGVPTALEYTMPPSGASPRVLMDQTHVPHNSPPMVQHDEAAWGNERVFELNSPKQQGAVAQALARQAPRCAGGPPPRDQANRGKATSKLRE